MNTERYWISTGRIWALAKPLRMDSMDIASIEAITHSPRSQGWTEGNSFRESEAAELVRRANAYDALLESLSQAVRYIEVANAYQGAMTAAEVEAKILFNRKIGTSAVQIAANSCHTLATFSFDKARALLDSLKEFRN